MWDLVVGDIAIYGWILAILLWGVTMYIRFHPKIAFKDMATEIYWVVEQIDQASKGAIKGENKWAIYRAILLVAAHAMGKMSAFNILAAEKVGKATVDVLKEIPVVEDSAQDSTSGRIK